MYQIRGNSIIWHNLVIIIIIIGIITICIDYIDIGLQADYLKQNIYIGIHFQ